MISSRGAGYCERREREGRRAGKRYRWDQGCCPAAGVQGAGRRGGGWAGTVGQDARGTMAFGNSARWRVGRAWHPGLSRRFIGERRMSTGSRRKAERQERGRTKGLDAPQTMTRNHPR